MKNNLKYYLLIPYAVWVLSGIFAIIMGQVAIGLSFLWFPLALLLCILTALSLFWIAGDRIKNQSPKKCENCIFVKQHIIEGSCLGSRLGEKFGEPCRFYARFTYDKEGTDIL